MDGNEVKEDETSDQLPIKETGKFIDKQKENVEDKEYSSSVDDDACGNSIRSKEKNEDLKNRSCDECELVEICCFRCSESRYKCWNCPFYDVCAACQEIEKQCTSDIEGQEIESNSSNIHPRPSISF